MRGDSGPIVPDASGAFSVQGTLVDTGGPETTHRDVTFAGTATKSTITLTVSWPTTMDTATGPKPYTMTFGPVALTKGVVPTHWPGCI
jgi:hypothetical protein